MHEVVRESDSNDERLHRRSARRLRAGVVIALLSTAGAACAGKSTPGAPAPASRPRPYVLLISLDAFRHDYLDRYRLPALDRIALAGVRAEALLPPFPSKTFPSHYTIVTGFHPGRHGIVGNNFYDVPTDRWFRLRDTAAVRDASWFGGEPIWVTAEREGVKSAVYFWPGSEARVNGVRPSYWKPYDAAVPNTQRVDEIVAWLRLPASRRPHLLLLYLSDLDDTTHRHGPSTPRTAVAAESVQRTLARLFDSVAVLPQRDSLDVVVVSDHGMTDAPQSRAVPVRRVLAAEGIDTNRVRMGDNGASMSLWFGGDDALARRSVKALERGLRNARVYARGATPPHWHLDGNQRAGDAIIVGELGHVIVRSASDRLGDAGAHGWDATHPDMHGIFLAAGPHVRAAGRIAAFESVHVYPFLASLLGLRRASRTDGDPDVLAPYLRSAPGY